MKGVTSAIHLRIYIEQISDRRMKEGREGRRGRGEGRGEGEDKERLTYSCVHPRRRIHKLEQEVTHGELPIRFEICIAEIYAHDNSWVDILSPAKQHEK